MRLISAGHSATDLRVLTDTMPVKVGLRLRENAGAALPLGRGFFGVSL